jgi:hypothetical protein
MNELLAQAYGTENNITVNTGAETEKTAESVLLEELEKVAAAEGIDLNEFDDNDIIEIINEAMGGVEAAEKTASADVDETTGDTTDGEQTKLAEADFLGRTMAHAFYDELTSIQHNDVEKTASTGDRNSDNFLKVATGETDGTAVEATGTDVDPEFAQAFEDAAMTRAQEIIDYLDTGSVKQSSVAVDDEQLNSALTERAGELLDEAGYDVNAIASAIS